MVNALPAAGLCELWRLFENIWFNLFMEPRHFLDVTGHGSRVAAHDPLVSLLACLRVCLSPLHSIIRPQAVNENKVLDTRQSSTLWRKESHLQTLWVKVWSTGSALKTLLNSKSNYFFQTFFLYKEHLASRHFSECNFPMQCYKSFYHFLWGRGTGKIMWSSS